jgi:hypothetical protein
MGMLLFPPAKGSNPIYCNNKDARRASFDSGDGSSSKGMYPYDAPGIPVDGIFGVLEEVWGSGTCKMVGHI